MKSLFLVWISGLKNTHIFEQSEKKSSCMQFWWKPVLISHPLTWPWKKSQLLLNWCFLSWRQALKIYEKIICYYYVVCTHLLAAAKTEISGWKLRFIKHYNNYKKYVMFLISFIKNIFFIICNFSRKQKLMQSKIRTVLLFCKYIKCNNNMWWNCDHVYIVYCTLRLYVSVIRL